MTDLFFAIIQVTVIPCLVCFVLGGVAGILIMVIIEKICDKRESANDIESGDSDGV